MYLADVSTAASVLPGIIGLTRGTLRDLERRTLLLWLLSLGVQDIAVLLTTNQQGSTWWITWFGYPVMLWLGMLALLRFDVMEPFRRFFLPLLLIFLTLWALGGILRDQQHGFSFFVAPVQSFILLVVGSLLLVESTVSPPRANRRSGTAAGAATMLAHGPFLIVWPLSAVLAAGDAQWLIPVWEARAALMIVSSLLFVRAVW